MRIGIDARLINQTGVGRYTQELINNLSKIDRENQYIIFLSPNDSQNSAIRHTSFAIRQIDIRWHSVKEQLILPLLLWRERLDLLHFPYFSVPIFYPGKFVVTIHDLILDHFDTGKASTLPRFIYKLKRLGYKLVMWIALHRAAKVITVSESTKKEIVEHYKINPEKVTVTYEAATTYNKNTGGVLSDSPLRCTEKEYLLYVGNAYPHKNLEKLLEAFRKLQAPSSNIKLILVGGEDYFYKRLKERVEKMGLKNEVIFYGPATREELTELYKKALALVFPSLMEGFGLPGLEAMAHGCPVLCSDIPVFREIYGEAALYFNPKDADSIKNKLEDLCYHVLKHDNILQDLKQKGFEQVKKYSWEKLARQTLQIYKSTQ